jgi:hypothetical protein
MDKPESNIPISKWNNNPGNIRPGKLRYEGLIGIDDRGFGIFKDYESGRAALNQDIEAKLKSGLITPQKFIDRYLGDPERDTENTKAERANYKSHLAKSLGLKSIDDPWPEDSAKTIADAIEGWESGEAHKKPTKATASAEPTAATPAELELAAVAAAPKSLDEERAPNIGMSGKVIAPVPENIDEETGSNTEKPPRTIAGASTADQGMERAVKGTIGAMGAYGSGATNALWRAGADVIPARTNVMRALTRQAPIETLPSTKWGLDAYTRKMFDMNTNVFLKDLEREMTKLNRAADPNAPKVKIRTMEEVQDAIRAVKPRPDTKDPRGKPQLKYVRPGLYLDTGMIREKTIPGNPGVDLSRYQSNPNTPKLNQYVKNPAKFVGATVVSPALKIAGSALGGLNAAQSAYDFFENKKKYGLADRRTIGSALQAAGGIGTTVPLPLTQALGWGAQGLGLGLEKGPEAYEYLTDPKTNVYQDTKKFIGGLSPFSD